MYVDLTGFVSGFYGDKDLKKFSKCTKLISFGSKGSASDRYSKHELANTSEYNKDDVVGISVNGARPDRVLLSSEKYTSELKLAMMAGVTVFVIDKLSDRNRDYNIGEREAANGLKNINFIEANGDGVFKKYNIFSAHKTGKTINGRSEWRVELPNGAFVIDTDIHAMQDCVHDNFSADIEFIDPDQSTIWELLK